MFATKQMTIAIGLALVAMTAVVQAVPVFTKEGIHEVQPLCRSRGGVQECCVIVLPGLDEHGLDQVALFQERASLDELNGMLLKRSDPDKKVPVKDDPSKPYKKDGNPPRTDRETRSQTADKEARKKKAEEANKN